MAAQAQGASFEDMAKRLYSCNQQVAEEAIRQVTSAPERFDPLTLLIASHALFQRERKDEAVFWFYAGQLRFRDLVAGNNDAGQILGIFLMTIGPPINNYAMHDPARLAGTIDAVLEWDRKTPKHPDTPPSSPGSAEENRKGLLAMKAKLIAEKESIEREARAAAPQIEAMHQRADRCRD